MKSHRRLTYSLKKFGSDNHMAIIGASFLLATLVYFKQSRENGLKNAAVVEGLIVACRPVGYGGTCLADVEFKVGYRWARRVSIKLKKQENCVVGQRVKVRCSDESNLVDILE